jgi:Fe-S-cluster-containing dehydrogenase component
MESKTNENDKSRRNFLKLGLSASAGTLAAGTVISGIAATESFGKKNEKVKVLTTDGKLIEVDKSQVEAASWVKPADHEGSRKGIPDRKFVMVIDLGRCKNARKCVEACQEGHKLTPDVEWLKIYALKDNGASSPYWFPRPCFHCDNPMCVSVCPVGATYKRSDGIVLVDSDRCIGCKFCMTGCPYSVRQFNWKEAPHEDDPNLEYSPETAVPQREGTVGKCVFCADNLRNNELPRCVQACPMGVIWFGDVVEDTITNGNETMRFSEIVKDKVAFRHLEHLGTEPSVYYLPPVNRQFPFESGLEGYDKDITERYKDVAKPENPKH